MPSGDISYNDIRNQIITDAFINIGVAADQQTLSNNDINFAARCLNRMLLAWQAQDLHLWLRTECILFLQQNQTSYGFTSQTAGDFATTAANYIETQVKTAGLLGATTVQLNSVTGITIGDHIGIILDSGFTYWDTITNINTGTTTVTVTGTLPSTFAIGNYVHTFTNKLNRPLRIMQARRYEYASAQDIQMVELAREDYFKMPNKTTLGLPTQYYYDPQLTTGQMYVWQDPTNSSYAVKFTALRQINDYLVSTDTSDLPTEWLEPIIFNLSVRLAPAYGALQKLSILKPLADEMLNTLKRFDTEKTYVRAIPDSQYMRR